jgi:hypothetical protein
MLLIDAIERRDTASVDRLSGDLPMPVIQCDVLPEVAIDSRLWFWQNATTEEAFHRLVSTMQRAAVHILHEAGFALGKDFSLAPADGYSVLLVTPEANDLLRDELPAERYATLQLILRFAGGEP